MSFDNALHDRKSEAGASCSAAISTPEALEHELALCLGYPWPVIKNARRAILLHDNFDRGPLGRMTDGILDEIPHGL